MNTYDHTVCVEYIYKNEQYKTNGKGNVRHFDVNVRQKGDIESSQLQFSFGFGAWEWHASWSV